MLAIETSCDDSCIAIAECPVRITAQGATGGSVNKFKLLSNLISSQIKIHRKWGGVYPALARREHQKKLTPLLAKALKEVNVLKESKPKIQKLQLENLKIILEREAILSKRLIKFLSEHKKPKIDLIAITVGPGLDPCLWTGVNFAKALSFYWNLPIIPINHIKGHIFANWLIPTSKQIKFPAICLIVSGGHTQIILMKNFGKYKILGEKFSEYILG